MFGHDDNHHHQDNATIPDESINKVVDDTHTIDPVQPADTSVPTPDGSLSSDDTSSDDTSGGVVFTPDPPEDTPKHDDKSWQHPGKPLDSSPSPEPFNPPLPATPFSDNHAVSGGNDLIDIKRNALDELSPLVNKLDQSPEEKFRTIMMMIQASDDQSLISKAYEAAHDITNEKARAQALLDIVNEINYFTQPKD